MEAETTMPIPIWKPTCVCVCVCDVPASQIAAATLPFSSLSLSLWLCLSLYVCTGLANSSSNVPLLEHGFLEVEVRAHNQQADDHLGENKKEIRKLAGKKKLENTYVRAHSHQADDHLRGNKKKNSQGKRS